MLLIIFPVVHQPSSGGSSGDEDSGCSECAGREGGAAGVMEGEGVAVLMGVSTPLRGVSDDDGWVTSLLVGGAVELRGMVEVVVDAIAAVPKEAAAAVLTTGVAAVVVGVAVEDMSEAEGTKGLASTLRTDPTAAVGRCVSV